ncbi:MAG TPA: AsmA family protein [Usitatibacter sp.]|nr:AsmA family protein [Usitatibacter sp.]
MTWRRASLWGTALLAMLLACLAASLYFLVDAERVRKAAAEHARSAWERELLMGDVRFSLFPVPSLRASKVSFANPAWAHEPHLLQAEFVRADLEILPLLTGKVRIKRLALDGVRAGLEVAEDGAVSWEMRPAREGAARDPATQGEQALQIAAIEIRNARIVHRSGKASSEPWMVEEATLESQPGHKDVRIEARLSRFGRPVAVKARFADLSGMGGEGATSEGRVDLDWGGARLVAEGRFPLQHALAGQDLALSLKAESLEPLFGFFGVKRDKTAPLTITARARGDGGRVELTDLDARLGALAVTGTAVVNRKPGLLVEASLRADRVDWLKALADSGGRIKPPVRNEEIFHEDPVAWRAVTAIGAIDGSADIAIGTLKLGNGLELRNVRAKVGYGDGRLEVKPFAAEMLGGTARGALRLDGRKKTIAVDLDGEGLLLERWFRERGSKVPFQGGPMMVKARLHLAGDTYRDLAASVTGRFTARMGKGSWKSERAGEYEEVMVRALQPKDGEDIEFVCAAVDLDFKSGRASGRDIVAARSDVSQLITSGHVDFRAETLDLRGKVISRSGLRVGLGSIASEVQVHGRLARPKMQLDPDAKPAVIARAGAAIATAGVSLLGSSLVDVAESQKDPCKEVLK